MKWLNKLWVNSYIPEILKGMANSIRHFFLVPSFTEEYPEKPRPRMPNFRGEHRLKKDELGREKCVACMMCSTYCPAKVIYIEAEPAPWPDREKRPKVFKIDLLSCIYCGMCEEACPEDAIELTPKFYEVSYTRQVKIFDKERLLRD
jgi:NADH-quinone oxidoreductase subunit I